MASNRAIATALGMFAETFPTREVTAQTAKVWATVLSDVTDEALSRAALRLCRDPERKFFPASGEVFAAIAEDAKPADVVTILHRIERLGYYDPARGWVYPNYDTIREALGEEIAKAYVVAGAQNLFADEGKDGNTITRDIARRSFNAEVERVHRTAPNLLRLAAPRPRLMPPVEPPIERPPQEAKPGDPSPMAETVQKVVKDVAA